MFATKLVRAIAVLLLGPAFVACASEPRAAADSWRFFSRAQAAGLLDPHAAQRMVSAFRRAHGLSAVTLDAKLMRLAWEQTRAMAARGRLEHDAGAPFAERIRQSDFDASVAVENLAAGYRTLAEAFAGWRDSPQHRANLLEPAVTRMGIAAIYAPESRHRVYWALILAAPDKGPKHQGKSGFLAAPRPLQR